MIQQAVLQKKMAQQVWMTVHSRDVLQTVYTDICCQVLVFLGRSVIYGASSITCCFMTNAGTEVFGWRDP